MKIKKTPMRRCIGCMESHEQTNLIRLVCDGDKIKIDRRGNAEGRGVYLCRNMECIDKARRKNAFNRSFRRNFDQNMIDSVFDELSDMVKEVTYGKKG